MFVTKCIRELFGLILPAVLIASPGATLAGRIHRPEAQHVEVAQSVSDPTPFRTTDVAIAFAPDPFGFLPLDEYKDFGVREAIDDMQSWSGLRIGQSNTAPNLIFLRGQGFDAIIESEDPLVRSILEQVYGTESVQQKVRAAAGCETNCFVYNITTPNSRVNATLVLLNSGLQSVEEAICFLQGIASSFGVSDRRLLNQQISLDSGTERIVLGDGIQKAFSKIYIF